MQECRISDKSQSTYTSTIYLPTGDPMWKIEDVDLPITGEILDLMEKFLKKYKHDDYNLSIVDTFMTGSVIKIITPLSEIPEIINGVYYAEKAMPLKFIAVDSKNKSYVVGMPLTRGRLQCPGYYRAENGTLKLLDEDSYNQWLKKDKKNSKK